MLSPVVLLLLSAFASTTQATPCGQTKIDRQIDRAALDLCTTDSGFTPDDTQPALPSDTVLKAMCRWPSCVRVSELAHFLELRESCDLSEDDGNLGEVFSNFHELCTSVGAGGCVRTDLDATTVEDLLNNDLADAVKDCGLASGFSFASFTVLPDEATRSLMCDSSDCATVAFGLYKESLHLCATHFANDLLSNLVHGYNEVCARLQAPTPTPAPTRGAPTVCDSADIDLLINQANFQQCIDDSHYTVDTQSSTIDPVTMPQMCRWSSCWNVWFDVNYLQQSTNCDLRLNDGNLGEVFSDFTDNCANVNECSFDELDARVKTTIDNLQDYVDACKDDSGFSYVSMSPAPDDDTRLAMCQSDNCFYVAANFGWMRSPLSCGTHYGNGLLNELMEDYDNKCVALVAAHTRA